MATTRLDRTMYTVQIVFENDPGTDDPVVSGEELTTYLSDTLEEEWGEVGFVGVSSAINDFDTTGLERSGDNG